MTESQRRRRRRSSSGSGNDERGVALAGVRNYGRASVERRTERAASGADVRSETWASRLIFFLLSAIIVLSALAYGTVHNWAVAVVLLVAVCIVLLWAFDAWRTGRLVLSRNTLQLPLCALILLGLVQLLPLSGAANADQTLTEIGASRALSRDPFATRLAVAQFAGMLVYFAAALVYLGRAERQRKLVWTIIAFGFLLAVFGLVQSVLSPSTIYWVRETPFALPFASFISRNQFASYMLMTAGLGMGLLATRTLQREQLIFVLFAVFVMCVALLATGARGALISLVAEIFFVLLLATVSGARRRRRGEQDVEEAVAGAWRKSLLKRAGAVALSVVAIYVGVIWLGGAASLDRFVGSINQTDPTNGRVEFWRTGWRMFQDHPILGVGLGGFSVVYTQYDPANGSMRTDQAHNDYLELLCVAGIVGAACGAWFLTGLFWRAFARLRTDDAFRRGTILGALAGCFGVLVHSFVDFPLHALANALLFLFLVALATGDFPEDNSRRS